MSRVCLQTLFTKRGKSGEVRFSSCYDREMCYYDILKTSGSDLSLYCRQKVLLVEGDRLVSSEIFSMLSIGCCEPDLHGELCRRNTVRGKLYIPVSGVGRKENI